MCRQADAMAMLLLQYLSKCDKRLDVTATSNNLDRNVQRRRAQSGGLPIEAGRNIG